MNGKWFKLLDGKIYTPRDGFASKEDLQEIERAVASELLAFYEERPFRTNRDVLEGLGAEPVARTEVVDRINEDLRPMDVGHPERDALLLGLSTAAPDHDPLRSTRRTRRPSASRSPRVRISNKILEVINRHSRQIRERTLARQERQIRETMADRVRTALEDGSLPEWTEAQRKAAADVILEEILEARRHGNLDQEKVLRVVARGLVNYVVCQALEMALESAEEPTEKATVGELGMRISNSVKGCDLCFDSKKNPDGSPCRCVSESRS